MPKSRPVDGVLVWVWWIRGSRDRGGTGLDGGFGDEVEELPEGEGLGNCAVVGGEVHFVFAEVDPAAWTAMSGGC